MSDLLMMLQADREQLEKERDALAALVGEMRGALFLAQDFGLCTCVGQVPNNVRAHFDNCLDVVVAHVLALDASAAERVLAERDARVRAEAVEPWRAALSDALDTLQWISGGVDRVLRDDERAEALPRYHAKMDEIRALLSSSGAPTEASDAS